jgi:histidyl-tRNA synthetase
MKTETIKGFKDYLGEDMNKRAFILELIKQTFRKYSFDEVETPIIEYEEFVKGENINDEAISDIFKLRDKGKRKLALRYEFTFQLKRIARNKKLPFRRFQVGPVFRDEPISGNRLRQFTQCDVDIIGSTIKNEAEVLAVTKEILDKLKIKSVIYINNRKLLNEILSDLNIVRKEEVIRELDKMDKLPIEETKKNLKKLKAERVLKIFLQDEDFFEKYQGYQEIKELKKYCKYYGVPVKFSPFLARGLSYYTGSVFEIKSIIKETICGGGSYMVGGNQATGIALGVERLQSVTKIKVEQKKILIVSLNEDKKSIDLSKKLRQLGKSATVYFGKPSKAMEYANSYGINQVVFVGAEEVKKKKFKVKDMLTGKEKILVLEKRTKKNVIVEKKR